MKSFTFSSTPEVIFGSGSLQTIPQKILQFGQNGLIVTGKSSFRNSKNFDFLVNAIQNTNNSLEVIEVDSEPTYKFIDTACDILRKKKINWVISIGGGSAIDAGKAISAMLPINDSIYPYLEGSENSKKYNGIKIPFIAVPTTAGTGSEATKNAVISGFDANNFKRSLRHDSLVPNLAIIDPELHLQCPKHITAASGLDALTQLIESYVSTQASPITDALAYDGIKKVVHSLPIAFNNGSDIEARANMAYGAYLSGITLSNAGLGTIHGFASSIGGMFNIPHGTICGTMLGAVNKKNVEQLIQNDPNNQVLNKYANIGRLFEPNAIANNQYFINICVERISTLIESLNIPTLSKFGVSPMHLDNIAVKTSNKNNPVKLEKDDLIEVLEERL